MDAPDTDFDIKLQKLSADLIADLDRALTTLLRKHDGHGGTTVRSLVRARDTFESTTSVLDMFQELPQLLDPHLPKWIPLLANSYLEYSQMRHRLKKQTSKPGLLVPLDFAISRILYAFCKVRGEKVIVRFFNVETRYLEVLLSAMEEAEDGVSRNWEWEQRYIGLLWLSHLLLAPFDLSTISTLDIEETKVRGIPGLEWPSDLPGITIRVIPLAMKYLASPGKERDAANALLVRIAMRKDMQKLGVLDALVNWSLRSLRQKTGEPMQSPHFYLGVLAFVAGVLRASADTSDMDKYLAAVFATAHDNATSSSELSQSIMKLAVARKMILKIIRSVVVSLLRQSRKDMSGTEMTETAIGFLLESVSDNDTPVRPSASKALSLITLKLDPSMAAQVVDAVLESLNRNVLWYKDENGEKTVRNLSAVNQLEWHGLVLTLSHLLYRRSPPLKQLSDIIHALLLGLSFEQRSTSGSSVGSNVRDAACFGIWALARRYTTKELLAIPTTSVFAAKMHSSASSIIQVLAIELVVAGCLDTAGNIRRGASAALQELIGRHPDTVERGIEVVQIVDYHAVARRSRAVSQVASGVTKLSAQYGEALVSSLLGWRGVGDPEASSRRVAGASFGVLIFDLCESLENKTSRITSALDATSRKLERLATRQVEERHGLLLCFASAVTMLAKTMRSNSEVDTTLIRRVVSAVGAILQDYQETEYRKPELAVEGTANAVVAVLPLILPNLGVSAELASEAFSLTGLKQIFQQALPSSMPAELGNLINGLTATLRVVMSAWLARNEVEVVTPACQAAMVLLLLSNPDERADILKEWAEVVQRRPTARTATAGCGYFQALALAHTAAMMIDTSSDTDIVCAAFLERWSSDSTIETRVSILQSLVRSQLLLSKLEVFLDLLADGLNDYTTTARGDEGSHVRVQALRAVKGVWELSREAMQASAGRLLPSILRLSTEKLDRVRPEAQAVVSLVMTPKFGVAFRELTFSSKVYFETLLSIMSNDELTTGLADMAKKHEAEWMAELLAGFVTAADTGNDDLVVASRTALVKFCETSREGLELACQALVLNLRNRQADDRVVIPTLEITAFMFRLGLFQQCKGINLRNVCLYTQKAGYKSGNIKKILACAKIYGSIAGMGSPIDESSAAGVQEARKRLGALLYHPWPRVRSAVVDELWGLGDDASKLLSVDWSAADKTQIRSTLQAMRLE